MAPLIQIQFTHHFVYTVSISSLLQTHVANLRLCTVEINTLTRGSITGPHEYVIAFQLARGIY